MAAPRADCGLGGGAPPTRPAQGAYRTMDRGPVAGRDPGRFRGAVHPPAAAQVSRGLADCAPQMACGDRDAGVRQAARARRHRFHLRPHARQAAADGLVPVDLRAGAHLARLGACAGRSDQVSDQDLVAHVRSQARRPHAAAADAHPSSHAGRARLIAQGRAGSVPDQMHRMRREEADAGEDEPGQSEQAGAIGERDHAGDHRRGRQHDADLKEGGCNLIVVVARHRGVALVLGFLGALHQLDAALMGLGFGAIALRSLLPRLDLLLSGRSERLVTCRRRLDRHLLRRRLHQGAADGLRLEECPQVRRLDIVADRRGLCAFPERLGEREEQRQDRDHQRNFLVRVRGMLGVLDMLQRFVRTHRRPLQET